MLPINKILFACLRQKRITLILSTGSTDDITSQVQQAISIFSPDSGDSGWPILSVISESMHFVLVEAWKKTDTFSPDVTAFYFTLI